MPERRASLLASAITAGLVVVPVPVAVVLLVDVAHERDEPATTRRHVKVRQPAALKRFAAAIVHRDHSASSRPPVAALGHGVPSGAAGWRRQARVANRGRVRLAVAASGREDVRSPRRETPEGR